jgi:hypothetical protein
VAGWLIRQTDGTALGLGGWLPGWGRHVGHGKAVVAINIRVNTTVVFVFVFLVCQRQLLFCFEVLLSVCERHLLVRGWMGVSLSVHDSIESSFIIV